MTALRGHATAGGVDVASTAPADARWRAGRPLPVRALITVVGAVAVLARLTGEWPATADASRPGAVALLAAAVATFGALGLVVVGRTERWRSAGDVLLLVAAVAVATVQARAALFSTSYRYPSDEGRLVQQAIATLAGGHDPYPRTFPSVARFAGNTPLFGGGGFVRFGYPPLMVEVGAGVRHLWAPAGTPGTVGALALLATAIVCFVALPPAWRGSAVVVVLALEPLTVYAMNGHPAVLALPLLCVACAGWSRIGAGGRLAGGGILRATCLGLAAAAQQLAWLPALGLLVAVWIVRRGVTGDRPAGLLVARFAAVAAGVFVLADLPFLVHDPRGWFTGVTSIYTQHPVAAGQGLVMLNLVLRGQGGDFGWYSYAAGLALLGVLATVAVAFRRVAVIVPVLLAGVFLLTARSQGEYLLLFTPLWLVWIAGTDPDDVARARPLLDIRAPSGDTRVPRGVPTAAALLPCVAAVACVVVAVATDGPLVLHAQIAQRTAAGRVAAVRVTARNVTDRAVRPHFYLDPASHLRSPWRVVCGPARLAPGGDASYLLRPALLGPETATGQLRVWALSDDPESISSVALGR